MCGENFYKCPPQCAVACNGISYNLPVLCPSMDQLKKMANLVIILSKVSK